MKQILCSFILSAFFFPVQAQTFTGTTGSIPDNLTEKCFTATVSGLTGNLSPTKGLARVCLDIDHTYGEDLDVYLVTPQGERIMLSTDNYAVGFDYTCFSPEATVKITEGPFATDDNYLAEDCFAFLNNNTISGNGTWRLCITDDTKNFAGTLNSWSLSFGPTTALECNKNPIARDRCQNATEICTLYGYCGNTSRCYTPDAGGNLDSLFAASALPVAVEIHNNSWLTFTANDTVVDLEVDVINCKNTPVTNQGIQLFITSTKDCNKFTGNHGCYPQIYGVQQKVKARNLVKGQRYFVMIDGAFGDVCDYTIRAKSGVKPASATATKPVICPGESSTLNAFAVGTGSSITYSWASNPPGTTGTSPTITVKPTTSTTYTVSIKDCNTTLTATTEVIVNPLPSGSVFSGPTTICSGNSTVLTASAVNGDQYTWYDAPSGNLIHTGATFTTPVLSSTTTYYVQATSSAGCTNTSKTQVTVTVNTTPTSPVIAGVATICSGMATTLTATAPGGTYQWYDTSTGGAPIYTGSTFTTPVLQANKTYYVEVASAAGCTSVARTAVPVTVHTTPVSPAVAGPTTICAGTASTLTASAPGGGGIFKWYEVISGGTPIYTGATFTTPVLYASKTYYVEVESNASCVSTDRTSVAITVNTLPADPVIAGPTTICSGNSATLTATAPGGTYQWYETSSGGVPIYTGPSYTTPVLHADKTYYVEVKSAAGCTSSGRSPALVTVHTTPVLPAYTGPASICSGNTVTLTATAPGGTYKWYETATGGTPVYTGTSFTTPVLNASKTYYLEVESAAKCTSTGRTPAAITVHTTPVSPSVAGATICAGEKVTLTASNPPGTYKWYEAATGGMPIHTGPSYSTPVLTATKTYYIEVTSAAGCTSVGKTSATVTVNTLPVLPVVTLPDSICQNTSALLAAIAPAGSTFRWYENPTGGNPIHTGPVYKTPSLITTKTYYVEAVSAASCTSSTRTPVKVKVSEMKAQFTANPLKGPAPLKVNFFNTSIGAIAYEWDFGDQSDKSKEVNPSHTYSKKGEGMTIDAMLIATSSFGCKDTAWLTIVVDPFSKLVVPNVFTPNNDNINDQFKVESIGLNFVRAELYSRWGAKIYEWNSVHEGWDGRTSSGVEAPQGTYYYMIIAKGYDGKEYEFKGHFTLLR